MNQIFVISLKSFNQKIHLDLVKLFNDYYSFYCWDCWVPTIGEELECKKEIRNMADQYAVAVIKVAGNQIVGHLPRKISAASSIF